MEQSFNCILIDDDIDEHEFFEIILSKTCLSIDCVYTRSCNEAITIAEKQNDEFKFIIVDWVLLDKIALGCSRELKNVSVFTNTQFVIYSLTMPPKVIVEDYSLSSLCFVKKDHSFESVAEEIRKVFAES